MDDDKELPCFSSTANPSETKEIGRLVVLSPKSSKGREVSTGKWLVFRPFTLIDETWHLIREEVRSGVLAESVVEAHCTTLFYNPSEGGPGPSTGGVIVVYTTRGNIERAGMDLIKIVQHDIKYKTNKATGMGRYAWKGLYGSVCLKVLYWNDGNPSFELKGKRCVGPTRNLIEDRWHVNKVSAPTPLSQENAFGRWVIQHDSYLKMTSLWHALKDEIEEGELGSVEMVCPPKINFRDLNEMPVFLVYTLRENRELAGRVIAEIVEIDIAYQLRDPNKPFYKHKITWISNQPVYKMILIH